MRYLIDSTFTVPQAARVRVVGLADRRFDESNWWQSREGVKAFLNNWLDLVHAWCMGCEEKSGDERWDPIEYERQLDPAVRDNL